MRDSARRLRTSGAIRRAEIVGIACAAAATVLWLFQGQPERPKPSGKLPDPDPTGRATTTAAASSPLSASFSSDNWSGSGPSRRAAPDSEAPVDDDPWEWPKPRVVEGLESLAIGEVARRRSTR